MRFKIADAVLNMAAHMLPSNSFAILTLLYGFSLDTASDSNSGAQSDADRGLSIKMLPFESPPGYKEINELSLNSNPTVIERAVYKALDKYISMAMDHGFSPAQLRPEYWAAWSDYITSDCETGLIAAHINIRELEYLHGIAEPDSHRQHRLYEELKSTWDDYDIVQSGCAKLQRRLDELRRHGDLDLEWRPEVGKAALGRLHHSYTSCARRADVRASGISVIQELLRDSSQFTKDLLAVAMS